MARPQKKDKHILGKLEMRIMSILWEMDEATCRDVFAQLGGDDQYAYTTVLSMMKHLEKKRLVDHREDRRAFVYRPLVSRERVEETMTSDFVDSVFSGSVPSLVNTLLSSNDVTERDLEQIEKAIRQMREGRSDER